MGCGASVAGSCGPVKVPCSTITNSGPGGRSRSENESKKNKKSPLRTNKAAELRRKANEAKLLLASNDSLSSKKSVKSIPRTTKSKAQLRNAQLKRKTSREETNAIATAPAAGEVGHLNAIPQKHHTLGTMAFEEANTIPLRTDTDAAAAQEMGPTENVNEIVQASAVEELDSPAEAKDHGAAGENLDVILNMNLVKDDALCEEGNGASEETKTLDTESSEQKDAIPAAANTANEAETFIPLTNDNLMTEAYQGVDPTPQESNIVDYAQGMGPNKIAKEIVQASAVGELDSPAEAKDHGAVGENLDVILNMNLVKDDAPCEERNGASEENKTVDLESCKQTDPIPAAANTANEAETFIPLANDVLMTEAYQEVDPTPQKSNMVDYAQGMGPNKIANEIAQASAVGELDSPAEAKDHGAVGENLDVILNMNLVKDDAPCEERNGASEENKTVDLESCKQTDPIPAAANTANEAETFIPLANDVLMTEAYQEVDPTPQKSNMVDYAQGMGPNKIANEIAQALAVEELGSPPEAKDHGVAAENLDVIMNMNLVKDDAPCEEGNGASGENKTVDAEISKQKDAIPTAANTAGEAVTSIPIKNDALYAPAYQEVDSIPQKSDMVDDEGVKEATQHTTYTECVEANTEMNSIPNKDPLEDVEVVEEKEPNKEVDGDKTIDIVPDAAFEHVDVTTNKNLLKGDIPLEEVTGTDAGSAKDADVTPKATHIVTTAADENVDSTSDAETNHIVENAASKEVDCTPQKNTVKDPANTENAVTTEKSSNIQGTVAETRETYTINSALANEVGVTPHTKHSVISLGDKKVDSDARTNCVMDEADAVEVGPSTQANQITDDSSAEKLCSIPDTTENLDPVLGGGDVDITATKEESSNFDDELDSFISEILQSQLDLVQKLPSPPKSPKPVNRRSPRVRSPTAAATHITQDTSKVFTQTNAAEENNASASSSTKGSEVDLEVVGSKCTIFDASLSPSSKDSRRSLKGVYHTTKSPTANHSHPNNSLRRKESFSPSKKQKSNAGLTPGKSGQSKSMEDVQRRLVSLRASTNTARSESKVGDKVKKNNTSSAKQSPNLRSSNSDTTGVSTSKSVNAKRSVNNSSHLPRAAQSSSDAKSASCKVKPSKKERKDRMSDAVTVGQRPKETARDSPQIESSLKKRDPKPKPSYSSHRSVNKEQSNLPKLSQREGNRRETSDSSESLKSRSSSQKIRKKNTAEKEAHSFSADRVAGSHRAKPPQTVSRLKTSPDDLAVKGSKGNMVDTKFRAGSAQRKDSHATKCNNGHNNEKGSEIETIQKLNSRSSSTSSRRSANLVLCDDKNSLLACEPHGTILLDERPMTAPQNGQDKKVLETPSKAVVAKGNSEERSNSLLCLENDSSTKPKAVNVKEGPKTGRSESRARSVTSTLGMRSSSAGRVRASATQFEQLHTKNTLAFARPSYPELRPKSSVGSQSSLNRMEVLSPEKHQGSSPKQRSLSLRELKVYSPPLEKQRKSVSPIKRAV